MLGRSVGGLQIHVGGPENNSNIGDNPILNNLVPQPNNPRGFLFSN